MNYRRLGRTNWNVSEIGYGMWGMAGWTGSEDGESLQSLQLAVDMGCNFFDTAFAYGNGHSERLLGTLLKDNKGRRLYTATKVPPKNLQWPARKEYTLDDCYPPDHIEAYVAASLANLGVPCLDLIQLHTWNDAWIEESRLLRCLEGLRRTGRVGAIGLSLNRWEPWNGIRAIRTGLIDTVQVIYNIFDQNPEDELFPACKEMDVGVIARVPFDEGTLTGTLTKDSRWPEGDWRNGYFNEENLAASVERAEALRCLVPPDDTMAQMAIRFILGNQTVSTTIPGMRKRKHVEANLRVSDKGPLPPHLHAALRSHRWDRTPASWSA